MSFQTMSFMYFKYSTLKSGHTVTSKYIEGDIQHAYDFQIPSKSVTWTLEYVYKPTRCTEFL